MQINTKNEINKDKAWKKAFAQINEKKSIIQTNSISYSSKQH